MNHTVPIENFGEAAPFERTLRSKGKFVTPHLSTEKPRTIDEIAETSNQPRRPLLAILAAMVRDGQAAFVAEKGWISLG